MAADASIYAQFRQPVKSVADYMAEQDQQEGNALKLAAARMDMQKAQQADADTQAIRGLARQHGGDTNALVKALYGGGYLTQAQGLEKSIADSLKARTDQQKTAQEIESKKLADTHERIKIAGQVFGFVKDNPTLENAIRAADFLGQNGILPPERVQATILDLQANPDPERIRGLATQAFQSALDAKEQLPKFFQQNRGGTVATLGVNPVTGVSTDAQVATVTQTPDSIARSEDAAKSRAQALQIAGMVDARAREGLKLQGERLAFDKTKADAPAKPMPATAVKMQDEDLNAIGTFAGVDKDIEGFQKQIEQGKLTFGPVKNVLGQARNYAGVSSEQSRNLATFKAKMETMRNTVLLLNKGVQTEGDAQRAMNELMANINDPEVVKQRLAEIRALNQRAVQLKKNNIDTLRRNFGQPDMDYSKYENVPGATNLPKPGSVVDFGSLK